MGYWPEMPPGVEDRSADVWEALLAVADKAGGEWPKRARVACVALVAELRDGVPSLGIKLLTDLKVIFDGHDHKPTHDILRALYAIEESPWSELRGKPLTPRGLANLLRPYNVKPRDVRVGANRDLERGGCAWHNRPVSSSYSRRSRSIKLEVSQRLPPKLCTSA